MPAEDARRELMKLENAEDRQRVLNEVCRRVLKDFQGRKVTPYLIAEAEGAIRAAIDRSIQEGNYVLPMGIRLDRVELGDDLRIKVFFHDVSFDNVTRQMTAASMAPSPKLEPEPMADRFEAVAAELEKMKG